jgi:hypothetical protein
MYAPGILLFIGTLVAIYTVVEFVRPLRQTNPFAG